jgi:RHS repeat-associated protein
MLISTLKATLKFSLPCLIFAYCISLHAQDNNPIQVFSPNAAELGRYGQVPVSYFNGLPQITIPLTTFKAKGYELPIYLSYYAGGNKPDAHPGWVGQGWSLHAGGMINRIVNGHKDEISRSEQIHLTPGYSPANKPSYYENAEEFQASDWGSLQSLDKYSKDRGKFGIAPDEFQINMEGLQASFYLVGPNKVKIKSKGDANFKVEVKIDNSCEPLFMYKNTTPWIWDGDMTAKPFSYISEIIITRDDGTKYHFGGNLNAIEFSITPHPTYEDSSTSTGRSVGRWDATATASSWMLRKVELTNGEEILFKYEKDGIPISMFDNHSLALYSLYPTVYLAPIYNHDTKKNPRLLQNISFMFSQPSYLSQITSKVSKDEITFHRSKSKELSYDIKEEIFKFVIGDFSQQVMFSDIGTVPYSAIMEQNRYMQLDQIKGNRGRIRLHYSDDIQTRLKLESLSFQDKLGHKQDRTYSLRYNSTPLPPYNSKQTDIWGYYNGKYYGATDYKFLNTFRTPDASLMKAEILEEITYPTGGSSKFTYEPHSYGLRMDQFKIEFKEEDGIAGGLRIKEIADVENGKSTVRQFTYESQTGRPSGILSGTPLYYVSESQEDTYFYVLGQEMNMNQLALTDGNHVTYSRVVERFADGGKKVYTYSNHDTFMDEYPVRGLTAGYNIINAHPMTSRELERGLLLEVDYVNAANDTIRKEVNRYNSNNGRYNDFVKTVDQSVFCGGYVYNISALKIYTFFPFLMSQTIIEKGLDMPPITTTTNYEYNDNKQLIKTTKTNNENEEETVYTLYSGDIRNGWVYQGMREKNMLNYPIEQTVVEAGKVVGSHLSTYKKNEENGDYVLEQTFKAEIGSPFPHSSFIAFNGLGKDSHYKDTEQLYVKYDKFSNIRKTLEKGGLVTTYQWEHDGMYPIGIFRNAEIKADSAYHLIGPDISKREEIPLYDPSSQGKEYRFVSTKWENFYLNIQSPIWYSWYIEGTLDGRKFILAKVYHEPSSIWSNYRKNFKDSYQVYLEPGEHVVKITKMQYYLEPGRSQTNYEFLTYSYTGRKYQTPWMVPEGDVFYQSFEDGTTNANVPFGFHSDWSYTGSYTVSMATDPLKEYAIDYRVYKNQQWEYVKKDFKDGFYTIEEASNPIDEVRVYPKDASVSTFTYYPQIGLRSQTDEKGITESYGYDGLGRLSYVKDNETAIKKEFTYHYYDQPTGNSGNYMCTRLYRYEGENAYNDQIDYADGLGRLEQTVAQGASPPGADLVSLQEYDTCGRELEKWLPVPILNNGGMPISHSSIKGAALETYQDARPYSLPMYDTSPLNRKEAIYGAGQEWHIHSRSQKNAFLTNKVNNDTLGCLQMRSDEVAYDSLLSLCHNGYYLSGELHVTRTADEDDNITFLFKNKHDKTVLIRQLLRNGTTKSTCDTYYIYNAHDQLVAILPPKAADAVKETIASTWISSQDELLRQYAYFYKYDAKGRLIAKKLPGCDWTCYVYDKGDRLIFSQDGNQRKQQVWMFTIPDMLGRQCLTGLCKNSLSPFASDPFHLFTISASSHPTVTKPQKEPVYNGYYLSGVTLASPILLSVNYYDDYSFLGKDGLPSSTEASVSYDASAEAEGYGKRYATNAQGLLTGTLTAQLDDSSNAPSYLYSVMYYDTKGRVVQTKSSNQLTGGTTKEYLAYNFVGQPTKRKVVHSATDKSTQTELYTYTYDHAGRPLTTKHQLNGGAEVLLIDNEYDELGRLKTNKRNGNANLRTDYTYNIRSWTKSITSPLFNETLYYNESRDSDSNKPCFNGNISAMDWNVTHTSDSKLRGYDFSYDNLSRLTAANYLEGGLASDKFSTAYTYDMQGNILNLKRRGNKGTSTYGQVDDVTFTYRGNQLLKATDAGEMTTLSMSRDFKDGADEAVEYAYDANGNMTMDANKRINSIEYNLLNLPKKITFAGNANVMNRYIYSAAGQKLTAFHQNAAGTHRTDYVGNLVYEDGDLSMIQVDGGYIKNDQYYFYLQDHLGSNRVVADASGNMVQTNHYYPYGTPFAESYNQDVQKYKYIGKEYDTENGLNYYDVEARLLDGSRFTTIDPLAEKYPSISPYVYCKGNPINRVDLDGNDDYKINSTGHLFLTRESSDPDRLFTIRKGVAPITVSDKKFLADMYRQQTNKRNPSKVFYSKTSDLNDAVNVFKFAADHTGVEWTLNIYEQDGNQTAVVGTKHQEDKVASGDAVKQKMGIQGETKLDLHSHPYNAEASPADMQNANATNNSIYHKNSSSIVVYDKQNNSKETIEVRSINDMLKYIHNLLSRQ